MLIKKVVVEKANRLYQLAPGLTSFLKPEGRKKLLKKTELIDLAAFNWPIDFSDDLTFNFADMKPARPGSILALKESLAEWYSTSYGVKLNPGVEIFIGSGITNILYFLSLAFIDPGDIAFVPDPGLPGYRQIISSSGGEPIGYIMSERENWSLRLEKMNTQLGRVARLLIINNPHNPTGKELDTREMTELLRVAGRSNIIIVNDIAYASLADRKPVSLLSIQGGCKVGVEIGSFAYNFGLPGIPFGFAAGHRDVISGIKQASRIINHQIPEYYCKLAQKAINAYPNRQLLEVRKLISSSRAEMNGLLDKLGLTKTSFDTVPFYWAKILKRTSAAGSANTLYRRHRILAVPGNAFGDMGEGYLRFSLTAGEDLISSAKNRIRDKFTLGLKDEDEEGEGK